MTFDSVLAYNKKQRKEKERTSSFNGHHLLNNYLISSKFNDITPSSFYYNILS